MKRALVFIDGSNFYFKLKELVSQLDGELSLMTFLFDDFSKWLVKPNKLVEIRYYVGAIKRQRNNPRSERMYADQQKFIGKLQQQHVSITFGQVIQHPDKSYH